MDERQEVERLAWAMQRWPKGVKGSWMEGDGTGGPLECWHISIFPSSCDISTGPIITYYHWVTGSMTIFTRETQNFLEFKVGMTIEHFYEQPLTSLVESCMR